MSQAKEEPVTLENLTTIGKALLNTAKGSPLYFKLQNPSITDPLSFERYFNPDLTVDSEYFKSLDSLLKCVEKNLDKDLSEKDQMKVCAKEYKQLRMNAFNSQLFYHYVNKKYFINELSNYRNESPY